MDTALIVFVIGTIASFLPMYWIALRLLGRRRARAKRMTTTVRAHAVPVARREFLDLLRQEAAQRAIATLQDAVDEARHAAGRAEGYDQLISARSRQSLLDAGRLVDSLFPREQCHVFRTAIEAMMSATAGSVGYAAGAAAAAISAFEHVPDTDRRMTKDDPKRSQGVWASLIGRGRAWIGSGGVRATA